MNRTILIALGLLTIAALAAVTIISEQRAPTTEITKALLFPGLLEKVNEVTAIEIVDADGTTRLSKDKMDWVISSRDDFPADFQKVKALVLGIAQLRTVDPKTTQSDRYPRLGVEDVETEKSESTRVLLKTDSDQLAALIIGKVRTSSAAGGDSGNYIRKVDDPQAWLGDREIEAAAQYSEWMERQVLNIPATRIQTVRIETPGSPVVELSRPSRDATDFVLANVPEGYQPRSNSLTNSLANVFRDLNFDDVVPASTVIFPETATLATYRTGDGLTVVLKTSEIDGKTYTAISANFAEPDLTGGGSVAAGVGPEDEAPTAVEQDSSTDALAEAQAINDRSRAWVYLFPDYKSQLTTKTLEDLIMQIPPPAPDTQATNKASTSAAMTTPQ